MVCHEHQFYYIHIPKCAGRSVIELFRRRSDHFTSDYYADEYESWERYKRITMVRHPLDRLVSMYHYMAQHPRYKKCDVFLVFDTKQIPTFKEWVIANYLNHEDVDIRISAEGFRGTDELKGSPFWFGSQWDRISGYDDTETCCDKVFRFEHGMQPIERWLSDRSGTEIILPPVNKTPHEEWQSYFDTELLQLINKWQPIVRDLKHLSYNLPMLSMTIV